MQNNENLLADVSGSPRLADRIIETLVEFGVTHVFLMPAETINALYDAARRNPAILAVLVRHEGNGALMASGYAKLGGRLGVVIGAGGPGATHLPIGAYDAKADHAPLLLIGGQVPLNQLGVGSFQEIDTLRLFADSVGRAQLISSEAQAAVVPMLCADAILRRRPNHLAVAQNVLTRPVAAARDAPAGPRIYRSTPSASAEAVERCARMLTRDGPAAIVVGAVSAEHYAALVRLARQLGGPLVIVPEGLHVLREPPSWPSLRLAGAWRDTIVAQVRAARRVVSVGPPTATLAELLPPDTRVVHLIPPEARQRDYDTRGPRLCGEVGESLRRLSDALEVLGATECSQAPAWAQELTQAQAELGRTSLDWMALDRALPYDAMISVEPGPLLDELVLALPVRERLVTSSFNHGVRSYALPAAIGALLARPERRAVALATCEGLAESMAALLTAARYGLAVVTLCVDRGGAPIDFVEYARSLGLHAEFADAAAGLDAALQDALDRSGPALVVLRSPAVSPPASISRARTTTSFAGWLVQALARAGVDRIYGSTRGGPNGLASLVHAVADHDGIEWIEPCHQESASMMASARAKCGAPLGVCLAADMPDLVLLLNGLYDAALDHAPILVLSPMRTALVDPARLLSDVVSVSLTLVPGDAEDQLERLTAQAIRTRTVVHAMLDWAQLEHPHAPVSPDFDPTYADDELLPDAIVLDEAAACLRVAERPLILVGRGAAGARDEILALADRLQAPIATTFPGRTVIPPSTAGAIGCVGSSGHRAAEEALQWCDVLIILGSSSRGSVFYRTEFPTSHRVVQIDEDSAQLGRRKPDSIDLHGSVAPSVRALLERLGPPAPVLDSEARLVPRVAARVGIGRFLGWVSSQRIAELDDGLAKRMLLGLSDLPVGEAARAAAMKLQGTDRGPLRALVRARFERWIAGNQRLLESDREPIPPPTIALALQAALESLGRRATITVDVGVSTLWLFRYLTSGDHDLVWTSSFATMGFAVPAAVALAERGAAPVVAWTGDGGIAITMAEFASAARLRLPLVVVVINNGSMAAVKWELEVMGWPDVGSEVHDCDFARYARACGGQGRRVRVPGELCEALTTAFADARAQRRPYLVDVVCESNYGPFPPKIHYSQGIGYAVALAREAGLKLRGEP